MAKSRSHLVVQHVERMSRTILEEHPDLVREYVKGKRGVYALYKRARLYYVGLASNLRSRLKAHLKDRHGAAWDSFSMYVTESEEHLRELEALTMRIAFPKGNRSRTKFARSQDLRRYFKRKVSEEQRRELWRLFGPTGHERVQARAKPAKGRPPTLAEYVRGRMPIRWTHRGHMYKALVLPGGKIRFKKRLFNSPSLAATAVTKRAMNGWWCWRFESAPGVWERIDVLRRRRGRR